MAEASVPANELSIPASLGLEQRQRSPSPRRNGRHAKGLSLNFPILLPNQQPSTASSPRTASPTNASTTASPSLRGDSTPLTQEGRQSPSRTSVDFLTLVAAQERRVLELREEWAKADAELMTLKKQWAIHGANKKKDEVIQVRRMPVSLDEMPSPVQVDQKELDEERKRRKALLEMTNSANGQVQQDHTKLGRRGSKRVFEGRHTRTLSLLSPTSTKHASEKSIEELMAADEGRQSKDPALEQQTGTPSLSRMPTLDGLVSPEHLQLGFGKTYKNLAAHRRSLPPGTADMFMKQGKQVVDGVREGLWTFFEDIRQATVGDEAVNGPATQQVNSNRPSRPTRTKSKSGRAQPALKDDSFWKEFGFETPKKAESGKENSAGHISQKSSTDSQNPPDLLEDVNGDENEDDWDNWESPNTSRKPPPIETVPLDSEGLPWPELKKQTPSKLTRTASDLMREWQDGDEPAAGRDDLDVQS